MLSSSLFLLVFLPSVLLIDSSPLGLPDAIKSISIGEFSENIWNDGEYQVNVKWTSFQSDFISHKIKLEDIHSNETIEETVDKEKGLFAFLSDNDFEKRITVKQNKTYNVTVTAVNRNGEGPSSPGLIFFTGGNQIDQMDEYDLRPRAPVELHVISNLDNRVNVTWKRIDFRRTPDRRYKWVKNPIEYTIHYGDTERLDEWSTRKTNETWIVLEDLNNGTIYSAYVTATEKNETSPNSALISIAADIDMTGLPKPIITISPEKEVYNPGDEMSFKCSLPSNTYMYDLELQLHVGSQVAQNEQRWVELNTKVDPNVTTATCVVNNGFWYSNVHRYHLTSSRTTNKTWTVAGQQNVDNDLSNE